MSAPQEPETKQARASPPNPSPPLEDDVSEAGNIFQRSDDEVEDPANNAAAAEGEGNNSHIIPKSPDEFWKRSVSMRGGRGGPAPRFYNHPNKYSPPLSIGMPSWGSMEDHGLEDSPEEGMNVITPAVKGGMQEPSIHPNMFRYPPSSPIKTSPPSGGSPVEEFEGGDEFLPPQPSTRRAPNADTIKTPRDMDEPSIHFPSEREPYIKPQFVRETKGSKTTPPRHHPSLVVDASTSHDSAETPGRSLQGGRVQVVGGDTGGNAWSLVSQSRSIESGEDSWSALDHPSPTKRYGPPPPRYHPYGPPITHSTSVPPIYPPRYGMPPGPPPPGHDREGWSPYPPRYEYGRYPYPPPHGAPYPPPRIAVKQEDEEEPHPLLKDYNPHQDSIARPQFQNTKKKSQRTGGTSSGTNDMATGSEPSPRKRRRRNPEEKLASAAAMAAAATAAAARKKQKEEKIAAGGEVEESDEDEVKTVGSVEDEDMPAAKRAAMASAVALRAAAGGSPCPPPKAASEVDFEITDPPLSPVHPPSTTAVLDSASQMTDNDVLCGRGGGTNSQMGNRRYRALVRDFQPTYLMARRREKPLMARSVVLVVRRRGGRFLRRDDVDGRLYEVGDEKAEAKTSQALREGLDVRATKTAANTLLGAEGSKKKKRGTAQTSIAVPSKREGAASKPAVQFENPKPRPSGNVPIHVPMKSPRYATADRPTSFGGPPPSHHSYPPHPSHDPYRRPPYHFPYPGAPPHGLYPYPPPHFGAYATPSRSKEPNPFSPPRSSANSRQAPLTPVHSKKEEEP